MSSAVENCRNCGGSVDRRAFLSLEASAGLAVVLSSTGSPGGSARAVADAPEDSQAAVHGKKQESGTRYEATVPDTLDLAERVALAVNALTGSADPNRNYETAACASMHARPRAADFLAGRPDADSRNLRIVGFANCAGGVDGPQKRIRISNSYQFERTTL